MKIVNLALANIKKGKSAAISLFIITGVAALLLNVGMTIIIQINSFYDSKVAELHDAHVSIIMSSVDYKQSYEDFLRTYSGVSEMEMEETILMGAAKFRYGDSEMSNSALLINADASRSISPLKLLEKLDYVHDDAIYLPYSFKVGSDYKLGDTFTIAYQDKDYSFRVAGFFETTMLGTNNMGLMKFLLPDGSYRQLSDELGEQASSILMSATLTDSTQSTQLLSDFNMRFSNEDTGGNYPFWGMDIETAKSASTITVNIVAMILVAFAVVIVLVSLIVIKFRVTNSIEDGMVNIGVLKAIGYTSWQILASIVVQFMLITLSAGVFGVILSYFIMPLFGSIISSLSGLHWTQSFEAAINLISVLIVGVLVLLVTLFSSLRIRKLLPVAALRGGIQTHSFRKNYFPLEKAKGGLHFLLACKTMISNSKQNITIALIMAAITFASVFSIVLYYNVGVNKKAFIHLVGIETSDIAVLAKSDKESEELLAGIEQMEGVVKVIILDLISTKIDGQPFSTNVSDNYSHLETNTVFKGRFPKYDNEISISWMVSDQLNKSIGDTVEVDVGGTSNMYLITGLSQSINNMGMVADLTLSGVQHLIPNYKGTIFNVYLEGTDHASFIKNIKARYGNLIADAIDVEETVENQTSIYTTVVFAVMVMILAITFLVVVLILYLVIKTMILKRKKEFGILKAIGYTTFQLMNQIAMSFVPIVILGVMIGCLLGYLYTNSLLSLLLTSAGIRNVQFNVDVPLLIVLSVGIIMLAYLVSMFVSRRIKKISAYGLITE